MDIDFVILWVDGNDPEWQKERNKYYGNNGDASNMRYRDWGILKHWFRAVEKNAAWVHKIFFVTCGHYPEWLNLDDPKLELVVYFNDDMFALNRIDPDFFFRKGLPRAAAVMNICPPCVAEPERPLFIMPLVDTKIINRNFNKRKSVLKHWHKWFAPCYGLYALKNLYLMLLN